MRFVSFEEDGLKLGLVCLDGTIGEITDLVKTHSGQNLVSLIDVIVNFDEIKNELTKVQETGSGRVIDTLALKVPVSAPSKIVAAPVNYIDHMEEMHQASHIDSLGVFLKAPSSLTGHKSQIILPYFDRRFDQECELALVIGRRAHKVDVSNALSYVFGYSVLLDITMRGGEDRSTRKSFDTFTPMGPFLVTPDEAGSLANLELSCWVNGELRQHAKISELIWGVPELISYVSSVMTLNPGDVITTGTPKGVGPIDDGDEIVAEISTIGRLSVTVSTKGAIKSVTNGASTGALGKEGLKKVR